MKEKVSAIIDILKQRYPQAPCALHYSTDWQLMIAVRLSAQCTDARVNIVCRELFARFPTAWEMANAELAEVEEIVRPCGLYHTKAQNIIDASRMLIADFGGEMPREMDELLKFPAWGARSPICCAATCSDSPRSLPTRTASAFADASVCTRKARKTPPG